jgi:hypothetical protein
MKPENATLTILTIVFDIVLVLWILFTIGNAIYKVLRAYALTTKKYSRTKRRLRQFFWPVAKYNIRAYIVARSSSNTYLFGMGDTVRCIMMYELDVYEYRASFVMCGYDRLELDVTEKMEEIEWFVFEWRNINEKLSTKEMLGLYINETKPNSSNGNRKTRVSES